MFFTPSVAFFRDYLWSYSNLQIKPFTIVEWTTTAADYHAKCDYKWKEYFYFPQDRDALELPVTAEEKYNAVTISNAFCPCMLLEGLNLQTIQIPVGLTHVRFWSTSEPDDDRTAEEERERIYEKWFPGVLLASQAKAKKLVRISVNIY